MSRLRFLALICGLALLPTARAQTPESKARLEATIDKLDKEDPGWSAPAMIRNMPKLALDKNIRTVVAKLEKMPFDDTEMKKWRAYENDLRQNPEVHPKEYAEWIDGFLARNKACLEAAMELAEIDDGVPSASDFALEGKAKLAYEETYRNYACLLRWAALRHASKGDMAQPGRCLRALWNMPKPLFGPTLFWRSMRNSFQKAAASAIEDVLSLGELGELDLAYFQSQMEQESSDKQVFLGLKEWRAAFFAIFERGLTSEDRDRFASPFHIDKPHFTELSEAGFELFKKGWEAGKPTDLKAFLDCSTELLQLCERADENMKDGIKSLESRWSKVFNGPDGVEKLNLQFIQYYRSRMGADLMIHRANAWPALLFRFRYSAVALACERYRLANGKWPAKLDDLVPKFIASIPTDPYFGKPIRAKLGANPIAVYSVGRDRKDNGGDVSEEILPHKEPRLWTVGRRSAADDGFQLWSVADRRKPAAKIELPEGFVP